MTAYVESLNEDQDKLIKNLVNLEYFQNKIIYLYQYIYIKYKGQSFTTLRFRVNERKKHQKKDNSPLFNVTYLLRKIYRFILIQHFLSNITNLWY